MSWQGIKLYHNCMNEADPKRGGRWMLKKTYEAITGIKPPSGKFRFKKSDVIGLVFRVIIKHGEYRGRVKAEVADVVILKEDEVSPSGQEDPEGEGWPPA